MNNTLKALLDIFFPPSCLSCRKKITSTDILFCPDCLASVRLLKDPLCSGCGKPFDGCATGEKHFCSDCLKNAWSFTGASAFFLYKEPISPLIQSLKYHGNTATLATLANIARKHFSLPQLTGSELIIPVPLHPKRLQERGFNQSALIARALFATEKIHINTTVLQKHRWTEPQTKYDGTARRRNLRNAFSVTNADIVAGKKIFLIDDVFTTGATINECAATLHKSGASEVYVFTLARVG